MSYFKRIFELSAENKKKLFLGILFAFLKDMSFISIFIALNYTFEHLDNPSFETIKTVFLILSAGMCYHFLLRYLENILMSAEAYHIFKRYRLHVGQKLKKAPMGYFSEQRLGNIQGALTSTITTLENYTMMTIGNLISGFSIAIILMFYFLILDIRLAALVFVVILIAASILNSMYQTANKYVPLQHKIDHDMNFSVIDMIRGMSVIKIFPDEQNTALKSSIKEKSYQHYEAKRKIDIECEIAFSIKSKLYGFVLDSSAILLILISIYLYFEHELSLSHTLSMICASYLIFLGLYPLSNAAFLYVKIPGNQKYIDSVLDIPQIHDGACETMEGALDLEFRDVRFSYDGQREIIKGVNLKIEEGQKIAIVGPSGSGKTTLINLITRFWDVTDGSILLANKDIRDYPVDVLLRRLSLVFQDVYLFNDSVMNNIKFADPDISDEQVYEVCKKARCHDFILQLKDGYHTIVKEGGNNFSGGEKQRISIARALLKDAPIILLDEATSSVDPENEYEILSAISELCKGKTVISIAHRLSTVENADQIFVVDDGRIKERGTHKDLLKHQGLYYDFICARQNAIGWKLKN